MKRGVAGWLLLRGLAREQRHWDRFPELLHLHSGQPIHCLDLPGVGAARHQPAPSTIKGIVFDLRRRWLALDPPPDRVLALSLGGMAALDWAARFPHDWRQVVVVNTSSRDTGLPTQRMRPRGCSRLFGALMADDPVERELAVLRVTSRKHRSDRALAARWAQVARERPLRPAVAASQLWAAASFAAPPGLSVPTLVVAGGRDALVHPTCSRRLADRIRRPLAVHPEAGHDLPLDEPEWLVERVRGTEALQ
jgi:pimeloyl-ACP methyl ester carboxylesterase